MSMSPAAIINARTQAGDVVLAAVAKTRFVMAVRREPPVQPIKYAADQT